LSNIFIQW